MSAHDLGFSYIPSDMPPLELDAKELQDWELQIHALLVHLCISRLMSTDELRRGIEGLEEKSYKELSYYGRWAASMTQILIERNLISYEEFNVELGDEEVDNEAVDILYKTGDKVRIKAEDGKVRWRKPHIRTPSYIFGMECKVIRYVGSFKDPSLLAFRSKSSLVPLYIVSIALSDIYKSRYYNNGEEVINELDTLELEVYQNWLEPVIQGSSITIDDNMAFSTMNHEHHTHEHDHAHNEHDHAHHEHDHVHHHEHDHEHDAREQVELIALTKEGFTDSPDKIIAEALLRLLQKKAIINMESIRAIVDKLENAGKALLGRELVLKAWSDSDFKLRLLENASEAALELGIETSNPNAPTKLVVVENTADVHNVIVCTLCSCYPGSVLGLSPSWYKSNSYRSRMASQPRRLLQDSFGVVIDSKVRVVVHDSTADCRYLVLPLRPSNYESLSIDELRQYITRDRMLGVAI